MIFFIPLSRRKETTVGDTWVVYIEARKSKWGVRHLQDHEILARGADVQRRRGVGALNPGPLAALMPLKLSDLTPAKVAA